MPLPPPKLDDRSYRDLVEAALAEARAVAPEWTDPSPSDPGRALIEAFAYLTDTMLFRLNQLPDKLYVVFLNLLAAEIMAPRAAVVTLRLARETEAPGPQLDLPPGLRASAGGEAGPVFTTIEAGRLAADATETTVRAIAAEWVEAEILGETSGAPGQVFQAARGPIIADLPEVESVALGIEADPGEGTRRLGAQAFEMLPRLAGPHALTDRARGFVVERSTGRVILGFGDGRTGRLPPKGRQVRLWYLIGGGAEGNVAAGQITALVPPRPGLAVNNPARAGGGAPAEPLETALARLPRRLFRRERAVTAADFEALAIEIGGVARATARTRREIWAHAPPGSVELLILPAPPRDHPRPLTREAITALQTDAVQARVAAAVDAQKPLGVAVTVAWVHCKPISIELWVEPQPGQHAETLRQRIAEALDLLVSPVGDWPLGRPIRPADVYRVVLGEPGAATARDVTFHVQDAPNTRVQALAADPHQPRTWFAAAAGGLYRSLNDAASWERVAGPPERKPDSTPDGEPNSEPGGPPDGAPQAALWQVTKTLPHPRRPGLVAALWEGPDALGATTTRIQLSEDCGESWRDGLTLEQTYDAAWDPGSEAGRAPALLLATRSGLRRWPIGEREPTIIEIDADADASGYYAIAVSETQQGEPVCLLAARERKGIWLAYGAAAPGKFRLTGGSTGVDIRVLTPSRLASGWWIWAGVGGVLKGDPGEGARRIFLPDREDQLGDWQPIGDGWDGGSCYGFAFDETTVYAASHDRGVLTGPANASAFTWTPPDINAGLDLRGEGDKLFHPIFAVASRAAPTAMILAGGEKGVYQRRDGDRYRPVSHTAFTGEIDLPASWAFSPAPHTVHVIGHDDPV